MRFILPSAAKLNLSLRVTGRRGDGYHDIVSLFLRLPSVETLLVSAAGSDSVRARGADIAGENIVTRALRLARSAGCDVPFLDVEILKVIEPGSGMGAGSGNGAAALRWLAGPAEPGGVERVIESGENHENHIDWRGVALKTGADVPFLFSGVPFALVSGIGEVVEPLEPLENFSALAAFPSWSVGTENAYARLDEWYDGAYPLSGAAARAEAAELCGRLRAGERVGLLPNDFAPPLMDKFPNYNELFAAFERGGARAWGITGSGAAAFALFRDTPPHLSLSWPSWVRQVLSAEVQSKFCEESGLSQPCN